MVLPEVPEGQGLVALETATVLRGFAVGPPYLLLVFGVGSADSPEKTGTAGSPVVMVDVDTNNTTNKDRILEPKWPPITHVLLRNTMRMATHTIQRDPPPKD